MDNLNIGELIAHIESEYDEIETGVLTGDSKFKELIHWNSMNSLVMIVMVEYEYKVIINENDLRNAHTIKDLADLITAKKN